VRCGSCELLLDVQDYCPDCTGRNVYGQQERWMTHCVSGHAWSDDNERYTITRNGHVKRYCLACQTALQKRRREARRND